MNILDTNPIYPRTFKFINEDLAFSIGRFLSEPYNPANYKLFRHGLGKRSFDSLLQRNGFESTNSVSVYPNPAPEKVTLSVKEITSVTIYDTLGKKGIHNTSIQPILCPIPL